MSLSGSCVHLARGRRHSPRQQLMAVVTLLAASGLVTFLDEGVLSSAASAERPAANSESLTGEMPSMGSTLPASTALLPAIMPQVVGCGDHFMQPAGSPVGAGASPQGVSMGDFNLDGKPDLAVANFDSNNVTILLGNGSGGFTQPPGSPVGAGINPVPVAVGDFNLDGKPDLAVANFGSFSVTILLGNGSGGFTQPATSPVGVGNSPQSLAVGDFNLDGKPDLVVANFGSVNVTILLGNGMGGFNQPVGSPVGVGNSPRSVAVGDFNLDGKPDLATANQNSDNVTILLGNGMGGFTQAAGSPVGLGIAPASVAVGDFNLDGKPDLVASNIGSVGNVTILLGNGMGGFTEPAGSPVGTGGNPIAVAVGDFNLDGKPDLAVPNIGLDNLTILLGNGMGGFTQPDSPIGAGTRPRSVAVGDFNLDGKPDLAVTNVITPGGTVRILLNTCKARPCSSVAFMQSFAVGAGNFPISVALADFNLDGKPDVGVANFGTFDVTILLGNGGGGFTQPAGSPVGAGGNPFSVAVGDFNIDGKPDLAVANGTSHDVTILLGNGMGGFTQPAGSPVGGVDSPRSVAVGDFNLDGKPDLAVANSNGNNVTILLGNGSGGFTQPVGSPVDTGAMTSTANSVAVGDFNLDGKPDLAVTNFLSVNVTILLGNGSGGFTPAAGSPVGAGASPFSVAVGDFNLDGKPDLAVTNLLFATVTILLGNGSGGFTPAAGSPVSAGAFPRSVAVGDFNLDGKPDLAVANSTFSDVTILLGNGMGGFPTSSTVGAGTVTSAVVVGDFNLDGKADLALTPGGTVTILLNACSALSPPTITSALLTRTAGNPSANSQIATVNDEDPKNTLAVTVNGGSSATVNGVTVSGISVDAIGVVRANVVAACGAMTAHFTLRVTDSGGLFNEASLTVTVVAETVPAIITCPASIEVGSAGTSAVVTYPAPTVSDNCPGVGAPVCIPASGSSFPLGATTVNCSVKDAVNNTASCGLTISVNKVTFDAKDPLACTGPRNVVTSTFTLTNNGAALVGVAATAVLPPGDLQALPDTCTADAGTCAVLHAATVVFTATLAPGQTATVSYQAQVGDLVVVGTQLCSNLSVSFGGGPPLTMQACLTATCPGGGPGLFPQATSPPSDQKAGSVLFYNVFTSSASLPGTQNTQISVTNTNPVLPAFVHLFFVDGSTCSIADSFICLSPNETTSFLASDLDPGTTGYIVGVAVDRLGCPVNFNYLIGDEYVKVASGQAANLGAESISALAGGLPFCNSSSLTAVLAFDGISYNLTPRVLAVDNIADRASGNDTLLVVNRVGGSLLTGAGSLGSLFGLLFSDTEQSQSFSFDTGNCQVVSSLSNAFPRTTPRFETVIPAGRSGWMKLWGAADIGIFGAAINFNRNAETSTRGFSQGHNLHKLRLTTAASVTIPIFPPSC